MNTAVIHLWIPLDVKGQRTCRVEFTINPIGSPYCYTLTRVFGLRTEDEYPVKAVTEWNSEKDICRNIDIATHYEYAKRELGIDLKKSRHKSITPPPTQDRNQTTFKFT